MADKRQENPRP